MQSRGFSPSADSAAFPLGLCPVGELAGTAVCRSVGSARSVGEQLAGCGDRESAEGSRCCARRKVDDEGLEKTEPDEFGRTRTKHKWSQTNQPSRVKQSSIHRIEGEIAADAAVRTGSLSSPPSTEAAAPVTFSARQERATRKKIRQRRAGGED